MTRRPSPPLTERHGWWRVPLRCGAWYVGAGPFPHATFPLSGFVPPVATVAERRVRVCPPSMYGSGSIPPAADIGSAEGAGASPLSLCGSVPPRSEVPRERVRPPCGHRRSAEGAVTSPLGMWVCGSGSVPPAATAEVRRVRLRPHSACGYVGVGPFPLRPPPKCGGCGYVPTRHVGMWEWVRPPHTATVLLEVQVRGAA